MDFKSHFGSMFIKIAIAVALIVTVGCGEGGGGDDDGSADSGSGVKTRTYDGVADIIIDYYDYNISGNLFFIERKSYQYDVEVITGPPKNVGSIFEQNAINLHISTTTMGGEGSFGISSAILIALQGGPVLLQYWDLNCANNLINGTLVDTHVAEAAAANQLYAWEDLAGVEFVLPFYLDTGTTINGNLTNNTADIQIDGQTTDGTRVFAIDIQARR